MQMATREKWYRIPLQCKDHRSGERVEENLKNSTLHMAWFDEEWNQASVWEITHEGNT